MAHDIILDPTYFWVTRVLDTLSALCILLILCHHCWILYGHAKEQQLVADMTLQETNTAYDPTSASIVTRRRTTTRTKSSVALAKQSIARWTLALGALTVAFIVFSFATILMLMLNIWTPFPIDYDCSTNAKILCIAFHLTKATFYSILIARLQVAFGTSEMRYSGRVICGLFAFVAVYTLFVAAGTHTMVYGAFIASEVTSRSADHPWCHVHIRDDMGTAGQIGILLWILMDGVISVVLMVLFQRPIRSVIRMVRDPRSGIHHKFSNLVMKCLVLCWLSTISNALALLLYLWRHIATLIEINLPFVCLCVVLMHIKYDREFKFLCRPCIVCYRSAFGEDVHRDTAGHSVTEKEDTVLEVIGRDESQNADVVVVVDD